LVRETIGDNPEAQENFTKLENTLEDPAADDETIKEAVTSAAGVKTPKTACARLCPKSLGATSLRPQPWTS
jgi:hypothetical protein